MTVHEMAAKKDLRGLARGGLLLLALLAIGFAVKESGLAAAFSTDWIDSQVRGQGLLGEAIFVAAAALFTTFGLPRQIVGFLAGYAFGVVVGTALALLATVIGCVVTFSYARLAGRSVVLARAPARLRRIDAFLAQNPFAMALMIRLLPVGSNLLTNLAAGVSTIGGLAFVLGSALGYLPQTIIFALVGSGVSIASETQIAISVGLFALSAGLGVWLFRRYGRSSGLAGEEEGEEGGSGS